MYRRFIKKGLIALLLTSSIYAGGNYKLAKVKPILIVYESEKKFYAGFALALNRVETYKYGPYSLVSTYVKLGYQINHYLAIEGRGYVGVTKRTLKHNYTYGIYLVPQYPFNKNLTFYGLVGYAKTKVMHTKLKINNYTKQSDFSYGVGVDYKFAKNKSIYIEYVNLINKKRVRPEGVYKLKVHGIGVGVSYRF